MPDNRVWKKPKRIRRGMNGTGDSAKTVRRQKKTRSLVSKQREQGSYPAIVDFSVKYSL